MENNQHESREEDDEDFFNVALQKSGCSREHHALQDCFADKGDWRKCGPEMTQFRNCMDTNTKKTKTIPQQGTR